MTTAWSSGEQRVEEGTHVRALDAQNVTKTDGSSAEVLRTEDHVPQISIEDNEASSRWLTVSPYLDSNHLLDLQSVDTPNRLLALTAIQLEAATNAYATVRYEDAFDWKGFMANLKALAASEGYTWTRQEFYVVEFRSKLKQNIDVDLLFKLDKESHIEATKSGGLLKYWYGVPDADRRNLATCLWRNKEDAVKGSRGPWHRQARAAISQMYEEIDVRGLCLIIEDNVRGWSFDPYG
ncbi:uncharacterized protein Z518_09063 [Rhinocladiella mackenziei CBS 650.93]|uniref:Rhinocladiella mackenziei CBS 650.93 unplaced genomic scaffold supercont1.7, whole genome shotgun sequence n=1 Tax=Rhinocladiella mackenziei CBS 650.93 TaxID=1442369 RepID=A0A0D2GSI5_9EURO|nr:uncharacterized protein Z518_09063 [Rhinocladiella mackenziei CBS 650.93]KIX01338.1 hypothetical protein Z518_09063 [Rhinocladiella mackenziei CBS 650.93]